MTRLTYPEFDAYDEALRGVRGHHRVLRGRQLRDRRLRVVDLHGVGTMMGRAGAASIYSGAGSTGCFSIFVPLSRHEEIVVSGDQFDRRKIAWIAPEQVFHIDSRRPASWMSVTMSCELVMSWIANHELEPLVRLTRPGRTIEVTQ